MQAWPRLAVLGGGFVVPIGVAPDIDALLSGPAGSIPHHGDPSSDPVSL